MTFSPAIHRALHRGQALLAAVFLGVSMQLLSLHVQDVRAMRDIGLPAALSIPDIRTRMGILQEQSDVARLQASVVGGSSEEMLHMYVLPEQESLDRLLSTLDLFTTNLQQSGQMTSLSPVHIGQPEDSTVESAHNAHARYTKTPLNFEADINAEGLKSILLFQDLSGYLTISDALSRDEQMTLLHLTEQENPAAVTALETFLSTDLLSYSTNPTLPEDQLLKSFTSDAFVQSLHDIMKKSRLHDVIQLLSGTFGQELQAQKLWPLRFIVPVKTAIRGKGDGQFHVSVMWEAYGRAR